MQSFIDLTDPLIGALVLITAVACLFLTVWAVSITIKFKRLRERWSQLLDGADGANIEEKLLQQSERSVQALEDLKTVDVRLSGLEAKIKTAKRYVGVVRYDAFDDVGGSQSFALAVYDENGDGAIVTSQVGRAECRVFAKTIKRGKADRELSSEEQQAIEVAAAGREVAGAK